MIEAICPFPSPSAHRSLAERGRPKTADDLQPWTAARCHRILRQLQCRLGTLRKLVQEARQPATRRTSKRASSREEHTRPPKRARYTYAQRRSTSSNTKTTTATLTTPTRSVRTLGTMNLGRCSPASERVDFSTPTLRNICAQSGLSGCSPSREDTARLTTLSLDGELQSLRRLAPEGHYRIYEAIFGWLSGLLRSTEVKTLIPHPKSLLGMCLRKVPAALAEIETWDREAAEQNRTKSVLDSSNASVELYGQLEAFGSAETGWRPLRLVVRAHALSALAEAVSEDLFEPEFVRLLAELYMSFKCVHDASTIVSSLPFQLAEPKSSTSTFDESSKLQPVAVIVNYLHKNDQHGAAFDCLLTLLDNGKLPVAWLYTKGFNGVWAKALEATATNKPQPSAIKFICTAMEQLLIHKGTEKSSKQDTKQQALVNVVAGLTATAVTLESWTCSNMNQPKRRAARRLVYILDRCVTNLRCKRRTRGDGGLFLLAMARYIAMANSTNIDPTTRRQAEKECRRLVVDDGVSSSQTQYRQALFLACSIAQCRGRACSVACHDVLLEICTMLDGLGLPEWFRNGLRMDGAFLLAQKTKDLRDLAFAEKLPATDRELAGTGTVFSGWRWEEGISEWVLLSPLSKTRADTGGNQNPSRRGRERGRGWALGMAGGSRCPGGNGENKGETDSHFDNDADGDSDGDGQGGSEGKDGKDGEGEGEGEGEGKDDSGDELSGEWQEKGSGICGLSLGNAARASTAGGGNDPGGRNPGTKNRSGIRSPTGRACGSQGAGSSSSALSAASSASWQSRPQLQSLPQPPSQRWVGVGGSPTRSSKRARTTQTIHTQTRTRTLQMRTVARTGVGRLRGASQRGCGGNDDDGDELV